MLSSFESEKHELCLKKIQKYLAMGKHNAKRRKPGIKTT